MSDHGVLSAEGGAKPLGQEQGTLVPLSAGVRDFARAQTAGKRLIDILIAALGLLAFGPAMLFTVLLIWQGGGSALFRQERVGLHGRRFGCLKFRTMCLDADRQLAQYLADNPEAAREWRANFKLRHDPRITRLGQFLRKWSIDELPQLINVLRGDMSIVGPRPIVPAEIEKYGDSFSHYASVKPGLTGLWQISGRSQTSYTERVSLDRQYVERWSMMTDLRIIVLTVPAVLAARGAQ